jgi:hypothetical protein
MNPFNTGLGALYGPVILHMPPLSVHSTVVNAFKCAANVKHPVLNRAWNLKPSVIEGFKTRTVIHTDIFNYPSYSAGKNIETAYLFLSHLVIILP